jgi:BCCT family betaine/carnitine transporter
MSFSELESLDQTDSNKHMHIDVAIEPTADKTSQKELS